MDWQNASLHEQLVPGSSNTSPVLRASLPPSEAKPAAGDLLAQMMNLSAARAPLATQQEIRATLQYFSRPGAVLPRDTFLYTNAEFLEMIGQTIEKHMIVPDQTGEVYVGVQRLSRVAGQLARYGVLLQNVRHICLYGLNDLQQSSQRIGFSHPRLVTLVLDRTRRTNLEWFWFIVLNIPGFQTALVAQQVEGDLWSDSQQARLYRGFWTFDPARVQRIVDILRQAAGILSR